MSQKYDEYLQNHLSGVLRAFEWIVKNIPDIFGDDSVRRDVEYNIIYAHDKSKYGQEEYEAYDNYFYGNRSYDVVNAFNYAWLHHIHNNPHHWQYWILNNDDPEKGEHILDMPDCYIIEMICDWWSFSFNKGQINEIFKWYDEHKKYMKLSDYTCKKVEDILKAINFKLMESDGYNGEEK
jgi:hypothetical protein